MKFLKWMLVLPLAGLAVFAVVVVVRWRLAAADVSQDLRAAGDHEPIHLATTSRLEVLPLYEGAAAESGLEIGLGVAYLVRTDQATILLDFGNNLTGGSPSPMEKNMAQLGVSLNEVDVFVISHTHFDHMGGQTWAEAGTFSPFGSSQPPFGDRPVYVPEPLTYPGSRPIVVGVPMLIAPSVATTGPLPYVYPFPAWLAIPEGREQALAVNVQGKGIVLITGCGHMGVELLLAHARAAFDTPIVGLIGGLHEGSTTAAQLAPQIQLLAAADPIIVAPSPHDSGPAALAAFEAAFPAAYHPVQVGAPLTIK